MLRKSLLAILTFFGLFSLSYAGSVYYSPALLARDTISTNSTVFDVTGRISFGYSDIIDRALNYSAEIFAIPGAILINNNTSSGTSARNTYSFGASVLPGMVLTNTTFAFLRLGLVMSHFTNASANRTGGQIGVGIQSELSPSWDIRGEYDYTVYPSITNVGTPRASWVAIGGVYRFDAI